MTHKQEENSSANPDLELVDAAIAFMQAAKKHLDTNKPIAGTHIRPDGSLWDYAVGLAHAAMDALGGGMVRDDAHPTGTSESVRLESSLQELIAHRDTYIRSR
jgi:hypothetical protein